LNLLILHESELEFEVHEAKRENDITVQGSNLF